MKTWKKNAVIATVLVLVCAGIYLNWLYADQTQPEDLTQTLNAEQVLGESTLVIASDSDALLETSGTDLSSSVSDMTDYFAAMRLSRQQARDGAVTTLQETIAYAEGDESATTTNQALEDLIAVSLEEAQIESLVIAKGYVDCVAYMTDDSISVAVASPEGGLQQSDVALLTDIVTSQSDYQLSDIRIIEVK